MSVHHWGCRCFECSGSNIGKRTPPVKQPSEADRFVSKKGIAEIAKELVVSTRKKVVRG